MKKRVKIRKSGTMKMCKSCKKHLLANKSKKQKKASKKGFVMDNTVLKGVRRMLPGRHARI